MLESLGLSDLEEEAYRLLVDVRAAKPAALGRIMGLPVERVRRTLMSLSEKGLATESPHDSRSFMAVSPELGLGVLLRRREEELGGARIAAEELQSRFRASMTERAPAQVLEVVTGREAVIQRFIQLQRVAKDEILLLDRPPYALDPLEVNPEEVEALRRKVKVRVLYESEGLEIPGRIDSIRTLAQVGEAARSMVGVPMKLAIADQRLALIPITREEPGVEGVIVLHESALLSALVMLFEMLWRRALPLPVEGVSQPDAGEKEHPEDPDVLALLALGMKDETMARQLDVTPRTITRRVARIMQSLAARTRFQAGMQAVQRGWLAPTDLPEGGPEEKDSV